MNCNAKDEEFAFLSMAFMRTVFAGIKNFLQKLVKSFCQHFFLITFVLR